MSIQGKNSYSSCLPFQQAQDWKECFFQKIFWKKDHETAYSDFEKRASSGLEKLKKIERGTWEYSSTFYDLIVKNVKSFLEENKRYSHSTSFRNCQKELLAFRLNIQVEALDESINPGFLTFAEGNHLYNSLMTHRHHLKCDQENHQIQILSDGEYIPWSRRDENKEEKNAKDLLLQFEKTKAPFLKENPSSLSLYGHLGLQNKDRYQWKKLEPFLEGESKNWASHFIQDPLIFDEQNKSYLLELCSSASENKPRIFAGDHTWIRLYKFKKTDQKIIGKMYSIGLYRPSKERGYFDNLWMPFRIKKGYLTYDISEEWGINHEIQSVTTRVNPQNFKKIKKKIEEDKEKNNLIFHLFQYNCDRYVHKLMKLGGFNIPTKTHFFRLFTYISYEKIVKEKLGKYPFVIQVIAKIIFNLFSAIIYLMAPLFNLFFLFLGSGSVDKALQNNPQIKPILASLFDFFKNQKLYCYSPWILSHLVKEEVENWRKKEIAKLNLNTPEGVLQKKKMTFEFPPEYSNVNP